jgi:hypothetical protein
MKVKEILRRSNVTNMFRMFENCVNLKYYIIFLNI